MELSIAQIIMIAAAVIVGLAFLVFGKQLKTLVGNTSAKVAEVLNNSLAEPTNPSAEPTNPSAPAYSAYSAYLPK